MDGPGFPITAGDGLLSIMVGGSMIIVTVGCGYQVQYGDQPGYPGDNPEDIMDGVP